MPDTRTHGGEFLDGAVRVTVKDCGEHKTFSHNLGGSPDESSVPKGSRKAKVRFVYFLGVVGGGPIKIGSAANATERVATIDAKMPFETELLAFAAGSRAIEALLHRYFAPHRLRGEWFTRNPELLDLIERVRAGAPWPAYVQDHIATGERIRRVYVTNGQPLVHVVVPVAPLHPGNYQRTQHLETVRRGVMDGRTYTDIAKQCGVSRERIRQIAERLGVLGARSRAATDERKSATKTEAARRKLVRAQRDTEVLRMIVEMPATRVAAQLGLSQGCVLDICHRYGVFPERRGRRYNRFKYNLGEIERLEALGLPVDAIAQEIGAPSTLGLAAWLRYQRRHPTVVNARSRADTLQANAPTNVPVPPFQSQERNLP